AGQLRDARSGACVGVVHHWGLRHHTGDVYAADAGATRPGHRYHPFAFRPNGIRRDVQCGAGRAGTCARRVSTAAAVDPHRGPAGRDEEVRGWGGSQRWACGPEGMLNGAERVWHAAGIADRLHLERFAVSKAAAHGQGGTVEFARSGKTLTVDAATPLMDAGE